MNNQASEPNGTRAAGAEHQAVNTSAHNTGAHGPPPSTTPDNTTTKIVAVVAIGAALALVTLVAAGLGLRALTAPTEMSTARYASGFCEATEDAWDTAEDLDEDYEDELDDLWEGEFSGLSEDEANELAESAVSHLNGQLAWVDEVKKFSDGHRLRGTRGEDLHGDILEWADDSTEDLNDVLADIREVDWDDPDDAADEIRDAVREFDMGTIDADAGATEVKSEVEDENCRIPVSSNSEGGLQEASDGLSDDYYDGGYGYGYGD